MNNGTLTLDASDESLWQNDSKLENGGTIGTHFKVSVYIYNGSSFTTVPATANIIVTTPVETNDNENDSNWELNHISVVGDSISTGAYPSNLGTLTGATIKNYSTSGITLSGGEGNTIVTKVAAMTEETDLIIIFGGTNDYWHKSTSIGTLDSTDVNTYLGALKTILNTLKINYSEAKHLFIFPYNQTFNGDSSTTNFGYGSLDDFRAALIKFCTENSVDYIDLGTTEFDSSIHTSDGVHANSTGHQIIAKTIFNYIENNY